MKTRLGKIAQLPKSIRDDLNQRLENGKQGPELLEWLNGLPETKELLAEKFDNQLITRSNLSDWRHGGFQDWRADQIREARIQRISESGESLQQAETGDLFENFARITVAEMMADLDALQKCRREKRSENLHHLVRDLARLQNAYNRSRWAALAWTKYNDTLPPEPETPNANSVTTTSVVPDRAQSQAGDPHDSTHNPIQIVYHTRCECGEPCPKCHAPDSEYPLDEVLRDKQFKKEHGHMPCDRHGHSKYLMNCDCDCPCDRCAEKNALPLPFVETATELAVSQHAIRNTQHVSSPPIGPIRPTSPIPSVQVTDFSRRMALLKTKSQ